jgi:hypothetical protein
MSLIDSVNNVPILSSTYLWVLWYSHIEHIVSINQKSLLVGTTEKRTHPIECYFIFREERQILERKSSGRSIIRIWIFIN